MCALQTPVVFDEVADEILFGESDGSVGLEVSLNVFFDGVVLARESGVASSGKLMFYRILACDLLADAGRWSRGQFRVYLVCCYLSWRGHVRCSCRSKMERAA
jgi:hypothetical protein